MLHCNLQLACFWDKMQLYVYIYQTFDSMYYFCVYLVCFENILTERTKKQVVINTQVNT